jgi:hypothetical protein
VGGACLCILCLCRIPEAEYRAHIAKCESRPQTEKTDAAKAPDSAHDEMEEKIVTQPSTEPHETPKKYVVNGGMIWCSSCHGHFVENLFEKHLTKCKHHLKKVALEEARRVKAQRAKQLKEEKEKKERLKRQKEAAMEAKADASRKRNFKKRKLVYQTMEELTPSDGCPVLTRQHKESNKRYLYATDILTDGCSRPLWEGPRTEFKYAKNTHFQQEEIAKKLSDTSCKCDALKVRLPQIAAFRSLLLTFEFADDRRRSSPSPTRMVVTCSCGLRTIQNPKGVDSLMGIWRL